MYNFQVDLKQMKEASCIVQGWYITAKVRYKSKGLKRWNQNKVSDLLYSAVAALLILGPKLIITLSQALAFHHINT